MNLLVKTAEKMSQGPITISGIRQPPTRAFMDDMTITAKSAQAYKVKKPGSEERESSGPFPLQN